MTRRSVATAVAAVLGIAVSVALAWAASQLAGQRVGLSSEPLSVATGLAPHVRSRSAPRSTNRGDDHSPPSRRPGPAVSHTSSAQSPPQSTAPPPPTMTPTVPPTPARTSSTAATAPPTVSTAGDQGSFARSSTGTARSFGHHGDGGDPHDD